MSKSMRFFNKVEFTIRRENDQFVEFGKDLLELIKKYEGLLIGYQLEDMDRDEFLCDDANAVEAERFIKEVYGVA